MKIRLKDADIIITSYLGEDEKLQAKRFEYHRKQREALKEMFPNLRIITAAAGWKYPYRTSFKGLYDLVHLPSMLKAEIHNEVFKSHYRQKNKALLLLDDDVIPCDMDGIDESCDGHILNWLRHPDQMPAPCLYFSCKGTLRDTYYMARKGGYSPTHAVTGWALMIHSSLKVKYAPTDIRLNGVPLFDDMIFRFAVAAAGKECLKCQDLFFSSFQTAGTDKWSVWCKDREFRRERVRTTSKAIAELYPWLLRSYNPAKLNPIWMVRGTLAKQYVRSGWLRKTENGLVPTPKLKQMWDQQQQLNQKGLLDVIREEDESVSNK